MERFWRAGPNPTGAGYRASHASQDQKQAKLRYNTYYVNFPKRDNQIMPKIGPFCIMFNNTLMKSGQISR